MIQHTGNLLNKLIKAVFLNCLLFINSYGRDFPIFVSTYFEQRQIIYAIESSKKIKALDNKITGAILPHHLLAADLIAKGFALMAKQKIKRIIIFCPDHFKRSETAFAIPTDRDFLTILGKVELDRESVIKLRNLAEVSQSNLFSHEHGIRAILPFMAYYFPQAKVLPIAISSRTKKEELVNLNNALKDLLEDSIIIQSTDFSHYLRAELAKKYDQESLSVLYSQNPNLALNLDGQKNVDSPRALFLQMSLQNFLNSYPLVIENKNSIEYIEKGEELLETTSYILAIYSPDFKAK